MVNGELVFRCFGTAHVAPDQRPALATQTCTTTASNAAIPTALRPTASCIWTGEQACAMCCHSSHCWHRQMWYEAQTLSLPILPHAYSMESTGNRTQRYPPYCFQFCCGHPKCSKTSSCMNVLLARSRISSSSIHYSPVQF